MEFITMETTEPPEEIATEVAPWISRILVKTC